MSSNLKVNTILPSTGTTVAVSGIVSATSSVSIGSSCTASNFKTGSSNLHSTGLTVGNNFLHSTGINVGTGATIHVPATNVLTFGTNSNERLRITSGGSVNIGTSELDQTARKFNVYGGAARVTQTSGGNTIEVFGGTTSGQSYGLLVNAGSTSADYCANFRDKDGTSILRIRGDGNVGIGSESPAGVLDLYHATSNTILNVKSGDSGSVINLIDNATRSSIEQNGASLKIISDTAGTYANSDIRLQVDGSTKMLINSDGKVGINESEPDTKLHITHGTAGEEVLKIEANPVTAGTGAKSKVIFQITQSNGQSARLAEIHSLAENGWGGGLAFNVKQSNSNPNNVTEEALRINSSDSAATNLRMVVDAYLQMGGYNNTNESFANLCTLFSARDMAGSSMVSGQTDTISGYALRRITSDGSGTFFFGPYGAFPAGDYTALFRLKVSSNSSSNGIGYIDIIGNGVGIQGRNTAPRTGTGQSVNMSLQPNDFTASNTYQYFALDFSKSNNGANIETRFLSYAANVDVYLDHVLIVPRLNHGVEGVSGMFDY